MEIRSISPAEARNQQQAGSLLVCAYEGNELFNQNHLAGAISLESFRELLPTLDKRKEIIFYCA